jgi:hypothetical protein
MLQYQCEYNNSDVCFENNEEEKQRMEKARLEEAGETEVGGEVNLEGGAKAAEDQANEISDSLDKWVSFLRSYISKVILRSTEISRFSTRTMPGSTFCIS